MDEYVLAVIQHAYILHIEDPAKLPVSTVFTKFCRTARWHHGTSAVTCYSNVKILVIAKLFERAAEILRRMFSPQNMIFDNYHSFPYVYGIMHTNVQFREIQRDTFDKMHTRPGETDASELYRALQFYVCIISRLSTMKNVIRGEYRELFDFAVTVLTQELGATLYVQNYDHHRLIADHPRIPRSMQHEYNPHLNLAAARILFHVEKCGDRLWRLSRLPELEIL